MTFAGTPFGDLVPFDLGGELTQAQYDYLDDRIIDFNDDGSLGLIFAGNPPPVANIDQELILTQFGDPEFNNNGGSLNIQGLPANDITQLLANLAPAAGEGAANEPTAEELAGIETAAGGDETTGCWSGVLGQIGTVDNINYNLSGDMSATFSDESDC